MAGGRLWLRLLLGLRLRLALAAFEGLPVAGGTAGQLGLHPLQFELHVRAAGEAVQLGLDVVLVHAGLVVEGAGGEVAGEGECGEERGEERGSGCTEKVKDEGKVNKRWEK